MGTALVRPVTTKNCNQRRLRDDFLLCPAGLAFHNRCMRILALCLLLALPHPAGAQSIIDTAAGTYGSLTDPATSCEANPHQLEFVGPPAHVQLKWAAPMHDPDEGPTDFARFDLLGADESSVTLRREGSALRSDTGGPVIWIMRFTANPLGYCWGRADRPTVFCERPQKRCDANTPIS